MWSNESMTKYKIYDFKNEVSFFVDTIKDKMVDTEENEYITAWQNGEVKN